MTAKQIDQAAVFNRFLAAVDAFDARGEGAVWGTEPEEVDAFYQALAMIAECGRPVRTPKDMWELHHSDVDVDDWARLATPHTFYAVTHGGAILTDLSYSDVERGESNPPETIHCQRIAVERDGEFVGIYGETV